MAERRQRNVLIECGQASVVACSKSDEVQISKMAASMNAISQKELRIAQRQRVRPESVICLRCKSREASNQIGRYKTAARTISGIRHDSNHAIFYQRAARPTFCKVFAPPVVRSVVKNVVAVQQCNQHIDVEQTAQCLNPFGIHQLANVLRGNYFAPRRDHWNAVTQIGAGRLVSECLARQVGDNLTHATPANFSQFLRRLKHIVSYV